MVSFFIITLTTTCISRRKKWKDKKNHSLSKITYTVHVIPRPLKGEGLGYNRQDKGNDTWRGQGVIVLWQYLLSNICTRLKGFFYYCLKVSVLLRISQGCLCPVKRSRKSQRFVWFDCIFTLLVLSSTKYGFIDQLTEMRVKRLFLSSIFFVVGMK